MKPILYDGGRSSLKCIVYFCTCFDFDPESRVEILGDCGVLQGKEGDDVYVEMLKCAF